MRQKAHVLLASVLMVLGYAASPAAAVWYSANNSHVQGTIWTSDNDTRVHVQYRDPSAAPECVRAYVSGYGYGPLSCGYNQVRHLNLSLGNGRTVRFYGVENGVTVWWSQQYYIPGSQAY